MLLHPLPVDNIQLQPHGFRHFRGHFRHPGRRHYVGRVIDQIPRQLRRRRQRCAHGHAGAQSVNAAGLPLHYGHPRDVAAIAVGSAIAVGAAVRAGPVPAAAVSVKPIQPQQRAFRNRPRRLSGIQAADARPVRDSGKLGHALASQEPGYIPADPTHRVGVKIRALAQPGYHNALGRYAAHRMQQRHFAKTPLDFAVGNQGGNRPVQRPVNRARAAAGLRNPLEQVDHQRRRGKVGNVAGGNCNGGRHSFAPVNVGVRRGRKLRFVVQCRVRSALAELCIGQ